MSIIDQQPKCPHRSTSHQYLTHYSVSPVSSPTIGPVVSGLQLASAVAALRWFPPVLPLAADGRGGTVIVTNGQKAVALVHPTPLRDDPARQGFRLAHPSMSASPNPFANSPGPKRKQGTGGMLFSIRAGGSPKEPHVGFFFGIEFFCFLFESTVSFRLRFPSSCTTGLANPMS